jgi:hypothetical protein
MQYCTVPVVYVEEGGRPGPMSDLLIIIKFTSPTYTLAYTVNLLLMTQNELASASLVPVTRKGTS